MRGNELVEELVKLAEKQGVVVRRESLTRGVTGGLCVLKGKPTLFVDGRSSLDAQIETLANVLRRYDWSTIFVHPAIRPLLHLPEEP